MWVKPRHYSSFKNLKCGGTSGIWFFWSFPRVPNRKHLGLLKSQHLKKRFKGFKTNQQEGFLNKLSVVQV